MTPLPGSLGAAKLVAWRLDRSVYSATWNSGEGAYRAGGRWNGVGIRAVYCSIDPATAILEIAVHTGFEALDTTPYTLTAMEIIDPARVHVVDAATVPNPNWLHPGRPGAGQQAFGDRLLAQHAFVAIPSAVSRHSWNLVFVAANAAGAYKLLSQERFALDTRLNPPHRRTP